jgi:glycosidase
MAKIYFNSWYTKYKNPFGAVKKDGNVTFNLHISEAEVAGVKLVIRYENGNHGKEYYEMTPSKKEKGIYTYQYKLNQGVGLYFYYFVVKETSNGGTFRMYYGSQDGRGGEGTFFGDENQVTPFSITCFSKAETPPDWYRKSVFYQIFPDRFHSHLHNGDSTGGAVLNPKENIFIYGKTTDDPFYVKNEAKAIERWDFFGGTLQGIIDKIDYLKTIGVNAIYLNPIFMAYSNHRYDTSDYESIDSMLGTERTFKKLVKELHKNGIRVILDGVFSHVGKNSIYFNHDGSQGSDIGATKNKNSRYFGWFKFTDWPNGYKSWWGIDDLPEIDKYNRDFQEYIYGDQRSVLSKWNNKNFDIDGWRLDVADELPDEFIRGIRRNLDTYNDMVLIGEVWEDASRKISYERRRDYILGGSLQACMNYPFRDIILALLNENYSPKEAALRLTTLQENYPKDVFLNNFNNIGTHDTERILTMMGNNEKKVKLSFGLLTMLPGVPCYYYGDEAGLTGGKDPSNRKFFPWEKVENELQSEKNGEAPQEETLLSSMRKWITIRKENKMLENGDFVPFYTHTVFGILRFTDYGYSLYVLNPTDRKQKIEATELNFTSECPLGFEKIEELIDGIVLDEHGDYFLSERMPIRMVR